MADIQNRLMHAYKYNGYLNEYLDMKGIDDFDFIGESEGFIYGLQMLYNLRCLPKRAIYYGNVTPENIEYARKILEGRSTRYKFNQEER